MNEKATIKRKTNVRVKKNQIQMIVEAIERNPFLNEYKASSTYTPAKRNEDWEKLAQKLNRSGGAIKSVRVWQKCWSDKKGEIRKKNNIIKAARLKTRGEIDEEIKLTPLDKRILLLIAPDAAEALVVEESGSGSKPKKVPELVVPKVEECPMSPANGSCNPIVTSQSPSQESNPTDSEERLFDTSSHLPGTEESHQPESLPQLNTFQVRPHSFSRREHIHRKVKDCPTSPTNGDSKITATSQPIVKESYQIDVEEYLRPDTLSRLPNTEESHQRESSNEEPHSPSQTKNPQVRPHRKRERIKPIVLKSDNVQKLVSGQTEMSAALTRCATALEKRNEIQERSLEIEKRKVDVKERLLKLKQQKADAFIGILSILKDKV